MPRLHFGTKVGLRQPTNDGNQGNTVVGFGQLLWPQQEITLTELPKIKSSTHYLAVILKRYRGSYGATS